MGSSYIELHFFHKFNPIFMLFFKNLNQIFHNLQVLNLKKLKVRDIHFPSYWRHPFKQNTGCPTSISAYHWVIEFKSNLNIHNFSNFLHKMIVLNSPFLNIHSNMAHPARQKQTENWEGLSLGITHIQVIQNLKIFTTLS